MRSRRQSPLVLLEALESRELCSASVGVQFVGLSSINSNSSSQNAIKLANHIVASGATNVQIECLPFEFTPQDSKHQPTSDPFAKETQFIESLETNAKWKGSITIAIDLDWYPHTAGGNSDQAAFWSTWASYNGALARAAQPGKVQYFLSRVDAADSWVVSTRGWLAANHITSKVNFTLVPVLEDTDSNTTAGKRAYGNILSAIKADQATLAGSATEFRRSCLVEDVFRVDGATLEIHGPWSAVGSKLQKGDTWSNDGTTYSFSSYKKDAQAALAKGVNALFWDAAFNGSPSGAYNEADRAVTPFSSTTLVSSLDGALAL